MKFSAIDKRRAVLNEKVMVCHLPYSFCKRLGGPFNLCREFLSHYLSFQEFELVFSYKGGAFEYQLKNEE